MSEEREPGRGQKPVPDPTTLTTQALDREIEHVKELLGARIEALDHRVTEKFDSLERRRLEQKKDTEDAVDAALTAQKEAVAKSETATGKQLEQQQTTTNIAISDLRRSLEDLKERIGVVAQTVNGTVQQRVGAREDRTGLYASIGAIATLIAIVGFVVASRASTP